MSIHPSIHPSQSFLFLLSPHRTLVLSVELSWLYGSSESGHHSVTRSHLQAVCRPVLASTEFQMKRRCTVRIMADDVESVTAAVHWTVRAPEICTVVLLHVTSRPLVSTEQYCMHTTHFVLISVWRSAQPSSSGLSHLLWRPNCVALVNISNVTLIWNYILSEDE